MLCDVVQEVQAQDETLVPSKRKTGRGEAEELKRCSKALSDGVRERVGRH